VLNHENPLQLLLTVRAVPEGTLAVTKASITSPACAPAGGVTATLVAVVAVPSLAGMRVSPTMVIGAPVDAARNVGTAAPPPLTKAELELRKAICACAALPSAVTASDAAIRTSFFVAFMACNSPRATLRTPLKNAQLKEYCIQLRSRHLFSKSQRVCAATTVARIAFVAGAFGQLPQGSSEAVFMDLLATTSGRGPLPSRYTQSVIARTSVRYPESQAILRLER
jgi:hypothetical protein